MCPFVLERDLTESIHLQTSPAEIHRRDVCASRGDAGSWYTRMVHGGVTLHIFLGQEPESRGSHI